MIELNKHYMGKTTYIAQFYGTKFISNGCQIFTEDRLDEICDKFDVSQHQKQMVLNALSQLSTDDDLFSVDMNTMLNYNESYNRKTILDHFGINVTKGQLLLLIALDPLIIKYFKNKINETLLIEAIAYRKENIVQYHSDFIIYMAGIINLYPELRLSPVYYTYILNEIRNILPDILSLAVIPMSLRSKDICIYFIKKNINNVMEVPRKFQNDDDVLKFLLSDRPDIKNRLGIFKNTSNIKMYKNLILCDTYISEVEQTEENCKLSLIGNNTFSLIKNPSNEMVCFAVRKYPEIYPTLPNELHTPEVNDVILEFYPTYIKYIRDEEYIKKALLRRPSIKQYIHDKFKNPTEFLKMFEDKKTTLYNVPKFLHTPELIVEQIKRYPSYINDVENPTFEMYELAIKNDPSSVRNLILPPDVISMAIEYHAWFIFNIDNPTHEQNLQAIKADISVLKSLDQTEQLCLDALDISYKAWFFIKDKTDKVKEKAYQIKPELA